MDLMKLVLVCLVTLLILYIILNYFFTKSTTLTKMFNGTERQKILASTLPTSLIPLLPFPKYGKISPIIFPSVPIITRILYSD